MRTARETFGLRSLKVRLALASALLILASVALTVIFVLREVGRSTEQIVLDSQEDDARRLAATISQRLVGLQRALRSVAMQLPPATLADQGRLADFVASQSVLSTLFSGVFVVVARRHDAGLSRRAAARAIRTPRRRPRLLQGHGARAAADDRRCRLVARLGRADRDPDDAGVRGQRQRRRRCSAGLCGCRAARCSTT